MSSINELKLFHRKKTLILVLHIPYLMVPFREKVKRIVQGGTQIYVNYPAVSNLNLEQPEIEEQQKIGSFFKQLDDTIALHQRKLDLLKEQKKGFLQKMFV
uniref:Type I restriction modification DNA specificity domain-containing protein n=2 Tax=Lactococcus lactis subsp. cremoris TaxID=1359 RepID=Q9WW81_LACLC|nr:hypothetical protein [Lactococcus cremoris]